MPAVRSATPTLVRTASEVDNGWLSRARGLTALCRFGLVAEPHPGDTDELARQSLTTDHPADDPAHWIF